MIWMPSRVQPKLLYSAIVGGLAVAFGGTAHAGWGGTGTTGTTNGTNATAPANVSGQPANGARSAAPAEAGRAPQGGGGGGAREAVVQNAAAQQRVAVANPAAYNRVVNQAPYRSGEAAANEREASGPESRPLRPTNTWTDPAGAGRRVGFSTGHQTGNRGYRQRPAYQPYLYRYYGGYYPIYVDVPVTYYGPDLATGYDGGPALVPDPGSGGVAPVIPPSSITVSPQDDSAAQPDASAATPAPDAAQDGSSPAPNPAIGPDSLVEAVQAELTRRGYYQGKVDAMFRADTEAAVRHFQQDNYLAPTGHLNEPTLHALNLD